MTDLSKELGEIKRRHVDDSASGASAWKELHEDRERLLQIIEVEIPGMLRARADELEAGHVRSDADWQTTRRFGKLDELRDQATLIESLTNEKEKG